MLVDWSQNDDSKTTVCVYSLRAKERPTVSTPVDWDEVERALDEGDPALLSFDAAQVLERIEQRGDLFAPVLSERQELPASSGRPLHEEARHASSRPERAELNLPHERQVALGGQVIERVLHRLGDLAVDVLLFRACRRAGGRMERRQTPGW